MREGFADVAVTTNVVDNVSNTLSQLTSNMTQNTAVKKVVEDLTAIDLTNNFANNADLAQDVQDFMDNCANSNQSNKLALSVEDQAKLTGKVDIAQVNAAKQRVEASKESSNQFMSAMMSQVAVRDTTETRADASQKVMDAVGQSTDSSGEQKTTDTTTDKTENFAVAVARHVESFMPSFLLRHIACIELFGNVAVTTNVTTNPSNIQKIVDNNFAMNLSDESRNTISQSIRKANTVVQTLRQAISVQQTMKNQAQISQTNDATLSFGGSSTVSGDVQIKQSNEVEVDLVAKCIANTISKQDMSQVSDMIGTAIAVGALQQEAAVEAAQSEKDKTDQGITNDTTNSTSNDWIGRIVMMVVICIISLAAMRMLFAKPEQPLEEYPDVSAERNG
jgi:hypothetical protein